MIFNKEYTHIISIGSNCRIGEALRECNLRKEAFPVDWMLSTMKAVNHLFEDDFKHLTNKNVCSVKHFDINNSIHTYILNEKYNINITHEKEMNEECIKKHNKRIKRMYDILNDNKNEVLIIRNLLDDVIYDELHKYYLSTENNYSDHDPSHIEKFNSIIKYKFPNLKFDILVINYTKEINYISKNIFNITSEIEKNDFLYDRKACIEIVKYLKLKS